MNELASAKRALSVTLRALRSAFPDDHDRRCLYAAAGLQRLLDRVRIDARIQGGDFMALVVSKGGDRPSMQGFGRSEAWAEVSYYWVETPELLLDVGPHLLTRSSSFPAAGIPLLAWNKKEDLPVALRYRTRERYDRDTMMILPGEIASKMKAFLDDVGRRWGAKWAKERC